jgi:hypothetical protein
MDGRHAWASTVRTFAMTPRASRLHEGCKSPNDVQRAEVVDLDLPAGAVQRIGIEQAGDRGKACIVDEDVHLASDGLCGRRDALGVGQIDADVLHPGIGFAGRFALAGRGDDVRRAGLEKSRHQRLPDAALGAGDENDLAFHLTIGIVDDGGFHGCILRHGDEDLLAAAIQAIEEPHPPVDFRAGGCDAADDGRPGIELHRANDQGRAPREIGIGRVIDRAEGDQFAQGRHVLPAEPVGQAFAANFLRRICDGRAILTDRQLERAARRSRAQPAGHAASQARRQVGPPLHAALPFLRMIAPVQMPAIVVDGAEAADEAIFGLRDSSTHRPGPSTVRSLH